MSTEILSNDFDGCCRLKWAVQTWGLDLPYLDQGNIQRNDETSSSLIISLGQKFCGHLTIMLIASISTKPTSESHETGK